MRPNWFRRKPASRSANNNTEDFKPDFYSDHGQFRVTLWNMNYNSDVTQDVTQDERKKQIILEIKKNNKVTQDELSEILNVSKRTIIRWVKEMDNVEYVSSGYSGHWEIKE